MRRDLVYFYPLPINQVYDAFTQGANQKFGKSCKFDPYKTLSFALNFSFKYNMNGGSLYNRSGSRREVQGAREGLYTIYQRYSSRAGNADQYSCSAVP